MKLSSIVAILLLVTFIFGGMCSKASLTPPGIQTRECIPPQYGGAPCPAIDADGFGGSRDCDMPETYYVTDQDCWPAGNGCVCGISCDKCCNSDPCNAFAQVLGTCR